MPLPSTVTDEKRRPTKAGTSAVFWLATLSANSPGPAMACSVKPPECRLAASSATKGVMVAPAPYGLAKARPTSNRARTSCEPKLPFSVSDASPPKPATLRVVRFWKNEPETEAAP